MIFVSFNILNQYNECFRFSSGTAQVNCETGKQRVRLLAQFSQCDYLFVAPLHEPGDLVLEVIPKYTVEGVHVLLNDTYIAGHEIGDLHGGLVQVTKRRHIC